MPPGSAAPLRPGRLRRALGRLGAVLGWSGLGSSLLMVRPGPGAWPGGGVPGLDAVWARTAAARTSPGEVRGD